MDRQAIENACAHVQGGRSARQMRQWFGAAALAVCFAGAVVLSAPAAADECQPHWDAGLFGGEGVDGAASNKNVWASAVFDDGSGPALYVGGWFTTAGGEPIPSIARWDGARWSEVGGGVMLSNGSPGSVYAMTVYDNGSGDGSALYVGGTFSQAGNTPVNNLARWDGEQWTCVGGGVDFDSNIPSVRAMTVVDNDSAGGPALYVAGRFNTAGGINANSIARWDGAAWSPLGLGIPATGATIVWTLAVFHDEAENRPILYAGGEFATAGGKVVNNIARWDGEGWSSIVVDEVGTSGPVLAIKTLGTGSDAHMFVGGAFTHAFGIDSNSVVAWDGEMWSPLGTGVSSTVFSFALYDDGGAAGPVVYLAGAFPSAGGYEVNGIARWDGEAWLPVGGGVSGPSGHGNAVYTLSIFDDGCEAGQVLYAAGSFTAAGESTAHSIAAWDGNGWSPVTSGLNGTVSTLTHAETPGTDGFAVYAGGAFTMAGGRSAKRIARWDGACWHPLGTGMNGPVLTVRHFDDGLDEAPSLYAGGLFTTAGEADASHIARWNGDTWLVVDDGLDAPAQSMIVYHDGRSSALYVGGSFEHAGGIDSPGIARWDGESWSSVGDGVDGDVFVLAVFDDGSGEALYAGGSFAFAGGKPVSNIARWNGMSWTPLGAGVNGPVRDLVVHCDGTGPALYAGGLFTAAGGVEAGRIARWDGKSWSAVGARVDGAVLTLASLDDGTGPALYAGGQFTSAGGAPASHLARWDGQLWSAVNNGTNGTVWSLVGVMESDEVPALYLGGSFTTAGDAVAMHMARWQGCPIEPGVPGDLTGDGTVGVADLLILIGSWGDCADCDDCPADFTGDCAVGVADLLILISNWS